jgi:PAS domain S-box-containing protein
MTTVERSAPSKGRRSAPPDPTLVAEAAFERHCYALLFAGLDHIDQGITVFDKELRLVAWNHRFLQLLDLPDRVCYRGSDFAEIIRFNAHRGEYGDGDVDELVSARVRLAQRFEPHNLERVRPNGRILSIRGRPLPDGGFVTVYTDVTEQRRTERLIREQNEELERRVAERTAALKTAHDELLAAITRQTEIAAALRRSEGRLQLVIDSLPAGVSYWDRELTCLFANRRYAAAYGLAKTDIIGRRAATVIGSAALDGFRAHVERAQNGEAVSFEHEARLAGGRTATVRTWLVPETIKPGRIAGFFVLALDITRHKKAELAILQAAKMEAVGQLSSGIAHDFNNLLTVILGNLLALAERPDAAEPAFRESLDPAIEATRKAARLTDRLLTFARRQALSPAPVDVDDLVAGMVKLFRRSLPSDIAIETATRGKPFPALADPHQLENALLNLALNARDAMPRGGRLRIETTFVSIDETEAGEFGLAPGDYVRIAAADTGDGMDAETQARVFEPFFTTKQADGGSGLGLSMVYGFVQQSHGAVRFDSRRGHGTTVTIHLPRAVETGEGTSPLPAAAETFRAAADNLLLLVEDDVQVRTVVRRQLTALGFRLVEASSADEALTLLKNVRDFTGLLADIVMPGSMSGLDLAHAARQLDPALQIVLMTGYAGRDRAREVAESPFPVLRKPFETEALAAAFRDANKNK